MKKIRKRDVQGLLPKRSKSAHKGTSGHALIIAGSPGKVGAAVMAVQSAFRSGVGLVTLLTHPKSLKVIAPQVKEAFLESFPTQENNYQKYLKDKKVIAIGPGVGFSKEAKNLVKWTLKHAHVPVLMDADALTIIAQKKRSLTTFGMTQVILTPHPGEMARLIRKTTAYVQSHRLEVAQKFSKKYGVYLVLKGAGTIIATPSGKTYINSTGNPAMATAGMGDVLTGMITSFIAQSVNIEGAIILAVYLHGLLADQWVAKTKATRGLMASDIIHALPHALEDIL
ncbi:MAG: NAD(P)H-hydrate dehydratase [Deltaproteobacteria bacterium GWA2_38_16]|nr:MAG: NAD(P)H-hydrate dehydratase [Deltaproteobacteria bacterium GWA2_38_16]OGQ03060.1 MAG: NAD(P)H-hydrate dehydratase [Deltaproteobacteria bacterium RIFCSPHIGHO2_02_FULL_38_15]OGQ34959.1 MAG: NAD(P)H-hydrate dehydratase [Deltaproteobacteria bacterium RIFCSPLOWO2_01_FULL_38_9]OGQ61844.1 MAG: NAD(P)H-hydrate dehydratase [Deltaproteobacteria bacterium RIFCSPLOWO2_12_FULL_38_8]HBQ20523.1 NAD(P)H-hydrate dehydratase [Deltaproteobacteria bacterium]